MTMRCSPISSCASPSITAPAEAGGPIPRAEVQRANRARLAAGRVDPALVADLHDRLHRAVALAELRGEEAARLRAENARLAAEVTRLGREAVNAAKDRIAVMRGR